MSSASNKIIKVKHLITGEIRRLALASWPDLVSLDETLRGAFGPDLPSPYALRYQDDDGDLISITSTNELREAADCASRTPNRMLMLLLSTPSDGMGSVNFSRTPTSSPAKPIPSASPKLPMLNSNLFSPYHHHGTPSPVPQVSTPPIPAAVVVPPLLYVSDWAPPYFVDALESLTRQGFAWQVCLETLVNFGGDFKRAQEIVAQSAPRTENTFSYRPYFNDDFASTVLALESAGFTRSHVVASLIRNGGIGSNAALELAGIDNEPTTSSATSSTASPVPVATHVSHSPAPRDDSLPPALLVPVQQLEAMGFIDRMHNIETLIKNGCDVNKCATLLTEELKQAERAEQAAHRARENAMRAEESRLRNEEIRRKQAEENERRKQAEAERRKQEVERRRIEQERRDLEKRRREAANIAVKSPEKMGENIARLQSFGFDTISSTTSLMNAGGDFESALEFLLSTQTQKE